MEYYSFIKTNEVMPFEATWMDPGIIILSEVSREENDKYHMLAHIRHLRHDTGSQGRGFPDGGGRDGVGGTEAAPSAKPLGSARPEAPARKRQIISAGWVWDAGGPLKKESGQKRSVPSELVLENYSSQP